MFSVYQDTDTLPNTGILKEAEPVTHTSMQLDTNIKLIIFTKIHNLVGIKLRDSNIGEVKVVMIASRSPLKQTVLHEGDLIKSINGCPVTSKKQAEKILKSLPKGTYTIEAKSDNIQPMHIQNEFTMETRTDTEILSESINQQLDLLQTSSGVPPPFSTLYSQNMSSLEEDRIASLKSEISENEQTGTQISISKHLTDTNEGQTEITPEIIFENTQQCHASSKDQVETEITPQEGVIEVTLKRTEIETNYGLELHGGADTPLNYIYVQSVLPYSPADRSGVIRPGDQLIMIGNECFIGLTNRDALKLYEKLSKQQQQQWETFILQRKAYCTEQYRPNYTNRTSFTPNVEKSRTFTRLTNLLANKRHSSSLTEISNTQNFNVHTEQKSKPTPIYTKTPLQVKHTTNTELTNEPSAIILNKSDNTAVQYNDSNNTSIEKFELQLKREENRKLGMVLGGGVDQGEEVVYIRKIAPGSVIAQDGRLKVHHQCLY